MALFTEGKLFKKAGEGSGGGGGGDQHNLGWYATQAALEEAYPTAEAGDWAIVGATDTVWIWDTDNSAWVDSDQKGQVTSVNGQTGAVTVSEVPNQTGNAGKFLTTDGTNASWATVDALPDQTGQSGKFLTTDGIDASWGNALANNATGTDSIGVSSFDTKGDRNMNLGGKILASAAGYGNIAIGYGCDTGSTNNNNNVGCIVIGYGANMYNANNKDGCVAIGFGNLVTENGAIAIGARTDARAVGAIQLGSKAGTTSHWTNSDANTFKVGNQNGNFEIMSANGTIPTARLTKVNSTITLTAAGWSSNTQTVNVTGMTATGVVLVSPDPTDQADYTSAGIICSAQAAGTLTFTCSTTPTNDIDVVVVML